MLIALLVFSAGAYADEDNADKLEKIAELVILMDMDSIIESGIDLLKAQLESMAGQRETTPEAQTILAAHNQKMADMMKSEMKKWLPMIVDVYDRVFTEKEVTEMVDFYKTETGQSMVRKTPVMMQESMADVQKMMQEALPKFSQLYEELQTELDKIHAE